MMMISVDWGRGLDLGCLDVKVDGCCSLLDVGDDDDVVVVEKSGEVDWVMEGRGEGEKAVTCIDS